MNLDIDWFWVFMAVLIGCLSWESQQNKDRCFEAAKAHIELAGCKEE